MDDVLFAEGYSASGSGYEPNDTLATAATLTEGTHTIAGTNVDWYRLNSLSGTISVTMTPGDATNLNMVLYNSAGEAVSADFQPTGPETVSYLAPADGTYYLKVFTAQFVDNPPPGTALNYALSVDMPEPTVRGPNDPGESLATATTITDAGSLPCISKPARSSGSVEMRARPFTRSVSPTPGMRNSRPMRGSRTMLRRLSTRLLPRRSGISSVLGSATRTKPAGSPRGEQSSPSGPAVAINTKGEASMKVR